MDATRDTSRFSTSAHWLLASLLLLAVAGLGIIGWMTSRTAVPVDLAVPVAVDFKPRAPLDESGMMRVANTIVKWEQDATLEDIRDVFRRVGYRQFDELGRILQDTPMSAEQRIALQYTQVEMLNYEGEPKKAYELLADIRSRLPKEPGLYGDSLYTIIFLQGMTALRLGETENCIMCRGESSCILPISKAAVHTVPEGSRLAIRHFTECLERFPDDLEVKWLLNVAHMTLGEYPQGVDPRYLVSLDHFQKQEFDIGKFRDVGHQVGLDRFNQSGGAIMDDFDNDGLLDIVTTTFDPTGSMSVYHNNGNGTFSDWAATAGVLNQLGGLYCVQTDFNNDGYLDVLIVRGAWYRDPVRPTLLRNNQDGTFTDVTAAAGLLHPANSISAAWADYDNDGGLDLFMCCERQPSRLYRNQGNETFIEVTQEAGLFTGLNDCKGVTWIDYDNDDYPDLYLNYLLPDRGGQLFRNQRNGTFQEVTQSMGITGPPLGFSCWTWDYDNDGWLDIFATCYERNLGNVVKGLIGESSNGPPNCLYRNLNGKGFEDVTKAAGLDKTFATMGSNFADFDNDGYLDMYLGTGAPNLSYVIPNRMFKNVGGQRFSEVTASSRTGNLQKGHAVACGDWDRDGNVDIFIQMGGATNGDKYHNILFQNPGHEARSINVKLIGKQTNRAAIGARIKATTAGENPQTVYRHVSSGSSFGANSLQQTIGIGPASHVARLEIQWPVSGTTQVFENIAAGEAIEITEFATEFRKRDWNPIPLPKQPSPTVISFGMDADPRLR